MSAINITSAIRHSRQTKQQKGERNQENLRRRIVAEIMSFLRDCKEAFNTMLAHTSQ